MDIANFAMMPLQWVGSALEGLDERWSVGKNGAAAGADWFSKINRLRILEYGQERFPVEFGRLDGGDKRIMLSFVDPEAVSNTISLLGRNVRPLLRNVPPIVLWMLAPERIANAIPRLGKFPAVRDEPFSEFAVDGEARVGLLRDALGKRATYDCTTVLEQTNARTGSERWFFINGIVTSRAIAQRNADRLKELFRLNLITIHNPTQGLAADLVESALQKFTSVNTEPVAAAIVQIATALADPQVTRVGIVAHSQGTIIAGDVLDLLYYAIDPKGKTYLDRTNMNAEDVTAFLQVSHARVNSDQVLSALALLDGEAEILKDKLELYMFANAASRMCYLDAARRKPHIESFVNEHDLVARLGCLAEETFHEEDLIRIDGPVFMRRGQYGHLLNAHFLCGDLQKDYLLLPEGVASQAPSRRSLHDRVMDNPCARNVKRTKGDPNERSRLLDRIA